MSMVDFKQTVAKALAQAIALPDFPAEKLAGFLEVPPQPELGDYAFPCFKLAAAFKKAPPLIALELSKKLALPKEITEARVAGPYLNFFVQKAALAERVLKQVLGEKEKYGAGHEGRGKKIVNEYFSPNTNKPIHLGHLRNICLGLAVNRLHENRGYKVVRATLYNDRGAHICKSMLAYERWGKGKTPESEALKSDHFVGDYYVKFAQESEKDPSLESMALEMTKKWEENDKPVRALWKKMNQWALGGFRQTLKRLGVEFDKEFFESQIYDKGKQMVEEGLGKGVFVRDEKGGVIVDLEEFGLGKKHVLRPDGTSLYITQDLYLAKLKFDLFKPDQSVYVVASEQNLHFRQLFKVFELLGFEWAKKCRHLSYGLVNLPEGRMKSREGTVVDADDILDELTVLAREELLKRYKDLGKRELEKRASVIALSALKFYMVRVDPAKDMVFNPAESISFDGETGPYLLYAYARAKSILAKAGRLPATADYARLVHEKEKQLLSLLEHYPQVVRESVEAVTTHKVAQFLLRLAAEFNGYYHEVPVLQAEKAEREARLALVEAASIVLKNALHLLAIETLERM